jgi:DNA-binding LacI/PurR family transcriptional regulator
MSETRRPARLHDVARAAGVHVSTASRVINDAHDASVRPETRERILAAARSLNYRPNAMARGLRLSTTGAIGFLVPSLRNPVNSPVARSAVARAWERGYVVLLAEDSGDEAAQAAYERLVVQHRIDGLVIQSARMGVAFFDHFDDGHVPCVFVDRAHTKPGRNVTMRDEDAGRLAADHLADLGHARVGHIAGPSDLDTTERRRRGFLARAGERGLETSVLEAPLDERAGRDAYAELLASGPALTALYVANFNQAIGALAGARAGGVRIPADLSLLSHDDDPLAEYLEVPLTAVEMPLGRLGAVAVDALIDQIEGQTPQDRLLEEEPRIVDRGSTAAPRA